MKRTTTKILSILLTLAMLVSVLPASVVALNVAPKIVSVGGIEVNQETNMGGAPVAIVGESYSAQIVAEGDGTLTYSAGTGEYMNLPEGLSINAETGLISGTCTEEVGRYNVYITVSNANGSANAVIGITVGDDSLIPEITTEAGSLGTIYLNALTDLTVSINNQSDASSDIYDFSWSLKSGELPTGMSLSYTKMPTVHIVGEPTETGTFNFELEAENAIGSDSKAFSITVEEGSVRPEIESLGESLPFGVVGVAYEYQIKATGTDTQEDPMLWSTDDEDFTQNSYDLGNGLTMSNKGLITGTPLNNNQVSFTVYAKNSVATDMESLFIVIKDNGEVTSVSVSPEIVVMEKGSDMEFSVSLEGYGEVEQVAYWGFYMYDNELGATFPQPTDSELSVDVQTPGGSVTLSVGEDEERAQFRVVAYSEAGNGGVLGYATVIIEGNTEPEIYHLTCNVFNITDGGAAGTVSIETDLESDEGSLAEADATENKSVTITAAANPGYEFVEWRKSAPNDPQSMVSTNASYTFNASESTWYYALFKKSEVFTQQPSFSRKDDNSGTVSFNLYSVEWEIQPMIIPADGNENSNPLAYFNNQTIAQSAEILKTNVAEGSYKIAVKYGDVWYFSDAFEVSYTSTLHFTTQPEDASVALGQPYYPEWAMDFVPDEVIIESGVMNGQQQLEWSTFSTYANATGGTIQAQDEGEYTLRVKATKGGEVVYSDVFVVTYADIYSFAVTPVTADWGTVGIASSYQEKTVEIENTGTKNILLEVGTKDGFAISIDNIQLTLAVGDTTTLRIRPNNNIPAGVYDFDLTVKATDGNTEKYSVNVPVYIKVEAPVFTTAPQDGVVPVNESYNVTFELSTEPDSLELQWWNDYSQAWATKTVLETDAISATVPAEDEATSLTYRIAANYNIGYTYTVAEEFTVEWEEVPQITEMSATVSGIEAGQTVGSATVSSGGNDYTTTIIQWQKTDDVWNYGDTVNYPALDDETTFIGGESYVVGVKFTPVAPNVISTTQVSATINGEDGKGGGLDNGSRIYFVLVEVPEKTYHITCNAFNISDSEDAGTVTLETDKGTFSGELAEGDATENSEVTITADANPGYEFVEWRKSAPNDPQSMVSTNASYAFTATESTWYYAIFQKATIFITQPEFNIVTPGDNGKITLTLNEGFNYADIQLVKENGAVDDEFSEYHKGVHFLVEGNTYTATEYKGDGTYQTPEGNYKVAVKIGDEWFYSNVFAVNYGVVEYTLTFDANGGTGEMDPLTGQTSYILPPCTFGAPSGMHFAGWNVFGYTQAPGTQAILTSDRTAQAVWEADLIYIINASQSGTYYFPNQQTGYASVDPLEVTITNEGTGATGELNIALYGEGANKFTLSKTTVSSIDAGEDDSFTVTPITGITPGVYVAQVMIQGEHNLLKTFDVSLTVTDAPTHIIEISQTENHTFTSANAGYGAQTPLTVTINSIGTGDSGELEIGIAGANPTSFELSKTAVDSIASGGNDSFTVVPKTGLEAGTYTATVYVSGEYDIYKVFGVSFTVIGELGGEVIVNGDAKYGSTLNADVSGVTGNTGTLSYQWMSGDNNVGTNSSSYTITEEDIGNTIKVIVTSDVETGNVTSAPTAVVEKADGPEAPVVTPHAPSLEGLSDGKITGTTNEMEWADNAVFTDAEACTGSEITGLEAGTYYVRFAETSTTKAGEAAVVVVPEGAEITYSISLDKADTFTFDSMVEGYLSMTPADVTITNTGTGETGELAVALSGANADSFTLSVNTIDNISAGGNDSFTVVPVVGLSSGTYTATITVSGSNDISESFNVSFTVTIAPVAPTYTVTFDANGGTVTPTEATTDAEGKLAELPTAERSNYTFKGWYTATTGGTKITTSTVFTEDTTVYAQWRRNGGGGGGGSATSYTVKFETNGGSKINNKTVSENKKVKEPTVPTKDGFEFAGWYTDKELTVEYDFDTKVKKNFTLYAKWIEVQEEPVNDKDDWFADVNENDWFYESVKYVTENGLMNGVTEDTFAPYETLTRAMLVTVLYRLEGEPATNRSIPFADIDISEYYASAVIWAQQNGIVNGITDTLFAPNDNITREQIAAIMFRYAIYKGMEAVTLEENLHFSDADKISEYAVSAMNWAVGCGLMKGKTATTVNPKDIATRAEIAAILMRFTQKK